MDNIFFILILSHLAEKSKSPGTSRPEMPVSVSVVALEKGPLISLPDLDGAICERDHQLFASEVQGADLPGMIELLDDLALLR